MSGILDQPQQYRPPMRSRALRAGDEWRTGDLVLTTHDDGTVTAYAEHPPDLLLAHRHLVADAPLWSHHWYVDLPNGRIVVYRIVEYFAADEAYGLEKVFDGYRY